MFNMQRLPYKSGSVGAAPRIAAKWPGVRSFRTAQVLRFRNAGCAKPAAEEHLRNLQLS